jgi:hypothetical protein
MKRLEDLMEVSNSAPCMADILRLGCTCSWSFGLGVRVRVRARGLRFGVRGLGWGVGLRVRAWGERFKAWA